MSWRLCGFARLCVFRKEGDDGALPRIEVKVGDPLNVGGGDLVMPRDVVEELRPGSPVGLVLTEHTGAAHVRLEAVQITDADSVLGFLHLAVGHPAFLD